MPAPLTGHFSVEESARLLRHYRYAVERLMRTMGGWIALTPELSAKLLLGRHVWDNAQHADAFGRRLPELRAHAQVSEPASPGVVAFMDALESPEAAHQTIERLVGAYRVLKPHLIALYEAHLECANPVYEPPTRRLLERCLEDERRHVAAGARVLAHLGADEAAARRAETWQRRLEALLVESGGVTGTGVPGAGTRPAAASPEAEEFIRLETRQAPLALPEDLAPALEAFAHAVLARDADAVARFLQPDAVVGSETVEGLAGLDARSWRLAACARLGAQRLIKLRLDGPAVSLALLARWAPSAQGWRVAALEVARIDPAVPA